MQNDLSLNQKKNTTGTDSSDKITGPLVIIPEEHNISLKFRDEHPSDDHVNLLKRYKTDLKLPNTPIFSEEHC